MDAIRSLLLTGDYSGVPADILVLLGTTVFFVMCASTMLKRLIE